MRTLCSLSVAAALALASTTVYAQEQPPSNPTQSAPDREAGTDTTAPSASSSPHQRQATSSESPESPTAEGTGPSEASSAHQRDAVAETKVADAGSKAGTTGMAEANIVGMEVRSGEEKLGNIEEVLFDEQGAANYAVISHGGVMGIRAKRTAVPWALVTTMIHGDELVIDRARLEKAPVLSMNDVTPEASSGTWSRDADSYWQSTSPPAQSEADEPT